MKKVIFFVLLVVVGQAGAADLPRGVDRFHDDEYGVTCWRFSGSPNAISCVPDSQIGPACSVHEEEKIEPRSAGLSIQELREEWFQL